MQEERVQDGSLWQTIKEPKYKVEVQQSAPYGFTHYRRVVSIREDGKTFLRKMRTANFVKKFEEASEEVAT